jgi:hypothetical protein
VLQYHTAGSPTDEQVKWTHLKPKRIAALLKTDHGISISKGCVMRLLRKHGFRRRKALKKQACGTYARRNEQFGILFYVMALMNSNAGPILCIDTKKKERLGNLYREGSCYCTEVPIVADHDYPHLSEGKVVPQGIYDMKLNRGYVSIGTSCETSAFICDGLEWWWEEFGIHDYPGCKQILILCDSGGANGYRKHIFKKELLRLSKRLGIRIIICHYPPYCSKYNPIEYRLFAPIHRNWQGCIFTSYELVKELLESTTTERGLIVKARIVYKEYPPGQRCAKEQLDDRRILFHTQLPELNYTLLPN